MKCNVVLGLLLFCPVGALAAQSLSPGLSLEQAVDAALAQGADQALLDANLRAARATAAQAAAKAGFSLSTSAGYNASQAVNDPARPLVTTGVAKDPLVSTVGSVTKDAVVPQNVTAGVTAGTPLTTVALKGTEAFQLAPDGTLNRTTNASATLTQVLWNVYPGGPLQATADKAQLTLQVAQLNAQANHNKLVLTVKQAFYTLLSAQEGLSQLKLTLQQRQDSLKFVQAKGALGQATGLDIKTAQINARTAELDLAAAQSALDVARRRLANLMGREDNPSLTAAVEPDPSVPASSLSEAIATALSRRVEPQVARLNAQAAAIDASLAAGANTPSVNVTAGVTYQVDHQSGVSSVVGVVGASLGLPLFDSGAAGQQAEAAAASRATAATQEAQLLRSIPVDVTEAWNAWTINRQRYEVAALAVDVALGQQQIVQAQFAAGLKNLSDGQAADVAVSTAQVALLKAKITAQLSALQLQNLLGL